MTLWIMRHCGQHWRKILFTNKVDKNFEGTTSETTGVVRVYGKVSDVFLVKNGVRQGDVLAPTLFNLVFDAVICMFLQKHLGHGLTVLRI